MEVSAVVWWYRPNTKYYRKVLKAGFGEYSKKWIIGIGEKSSDIEIIECECRLAP
jgi:hypothetical protein